MKKILRGSIAAAILFCLAHPLHAGPIQEEPSPDTVNQSDVIAVGTLVSIKGKEPFTHQRPPRRVTFTVETGFKGCLPGENLLVRDWVSREKPDKKTIPPPFYDGELDKWRKAPVKIPPAGTPVLLFLKRSKGGPFKQTTNEFGVPIWFQNPSEKVLAMTRSLLGPEGKSGLPDAVRKSAIVFTATAGELISQPDEGTSVVLKERHYLKGGKRTADIPHEVRWPESLPLPEPGDRLILCFGDEPGPLLFYAEPENYGNLDEVKKLLFGS